MAQDWDLPALRGMQDWERELYLVIKAILLMASDRRGLFAIARDLPWVIAVETFDAGEVIWNNPYQFNAPVLGWRRDMQHLWFSSMSFTSAERRCPDIVLFFWNCKIELFDTWCVTVYRSGDQVMDLLTFLHTHFPADFDRFEARVRPGGPKLPECSFVTLVTE